jgi:serine/threonine-protein kinase
MPIRLTVVAGPHLGRSFDFDGHDMFLVGRSQKAHFQLADPDRKISRIHFMIEINPPSCWLYDMGSHNGTFVNGQRVHEARLNDGDEIRAGQTVMRLHVPADQDTHQWTEPPPAVTVVGPAVVVPGYRIVHELGRGGMGAVHLAVREADGAEVAVKTVLPAVRDNPKLTQRFLRETEVMRQLAHPRIVRFLDAGEHAGTLFFVMEYVRGVDARRVLDERGPLDVRTAVRIVCQVLEGLAYAHGLGFVHRDIKPANVLLADEPGGKRAAKLADFGLARAYQASRISGLTVQGEVGGTPVFMAPEQITHYRDVKPAADQYSTAAMLYNLLTGKHTHDFPPQPTGVFVHILLEEPVPLRDRRPDVPDGLAAIVHTALAKKPEERYADAEALRQALLPFGR